MVVQKTYISSNFLVLNMKFLFRLSKKTEYVPLVLCFLISQFSAIKIMVFNRKVVSPIEDMDSLKPNLKNFY